AFYLFAPLVYLDSELRAVPGIAEKWEISPDGKDYTFHLNPNATFADRSPVLASDVLFSLKKIADPQTEAAQLSAGFEQIDLKRTRVIDDHTILVAFREALAPQLIRFNDLLVVPEHVYGKGDFKNDHNNMAVGAGPYRLVSREPGKNIVIERREEYWRSRPHIERVIFRVITDDVTAWNALKRGDIDETLVGSDTWLREQSNPALKNTIDFRRFYTLNYNFIAWNGRGPIFSDKRVRRAMAMCIDLQSIIANLFHGTARAVSGPFTPDQWAYNPDVPVVPFDPAGARQLLESAGWQDTNGDGVLDRNGKPLRFELLIYSGTTSGIPFAQLLQSELKKIGMQLDIAVVDWASLSHRVLSGQYQASFMGWDLDPDPDPFSLFHSSQFPPRGQNLVYYSNPEADRLIEEGRRELDFARRVDIYHRLHAVIAEDQPYAWTTQVSVKWGLSKRLRNVRESRGWGLYTWYPGEFDWWIPRDQRVHDRK
ncbi:MAG: ABC transporter substrate-binding protein, partial [Thermoanaerobaculia bacterium]